MGRPAAAIVSIVLTMRALTGNFPLGVAAVHSVKVLS